MLKVSGNFIARDGTAANLDIGFVPDYFRAVAAFDDTNQVTYEWWKSRSGTANDNGQYGIVRAADGGAVAKCADANNGIIEYDTASEQVFLPAASGEGQTKAAIAGYSTTTTYTARSTTALGSCIRPTTRNGFVYECTTASGGAAGTEPTWGTTVGAYTTATSGDVWICRMEEVCRGGAKGVTIGATLQVNSDEWTWEAELHDRVSVELDAQSYDPVPYAV